MIHPVILMDASSRRAYLVDSSLTPEYPVEGPAPRYLAHVNLVNTFVQNSEKVYYLKLN